MDCNVVDWWMVLAFEEREWTGFDDIVLKDSIGWDIQCKLKSYMLEKFFLWLVLMCFGTNSWNIFATPTFHQDEGLRSKVTQQLIVLREAINVLILWCLTHAFNFILFLVVIHSFDLMVIAIGNASIKGTHDPSSKSMLEDPNGYFAKGILSHPLLSNVGIWGSKFSKFVVISH